MGKYLAIPLVLFLAGCGAQVLMQGEPNFNTAILLPYPAATTVTTPSGTVVSYPAQNEAARDPIKLGLTPLQPPPPCIENPTTSPLGSTTDKTTISSCVFAVVAIIDDLYREYRITLHHFADDGNAAAGISVLGLTTAATGPIGATTGKVLTGFASFITGATAVLNQDLLYKQAIENIIHQMDADRAARLTNIINSMGGPSYTLARAKDDLLLYFAAGTWDDAITTIQTTIAANQVNCQAQADQTKVDQAQTQTGSSGAPPAANPTNCAPGGVQPPAPLTVAIASAGTQFQSATGVGIYTVITAATSATGNITVKFAPDGKNYLAPATIPFVWFSNLVNPAPIKSKGS